MDAGSRKKKLPEQLANRTAAVASGGAETWLVCEFGFSPAEVRRCREDWDKKNRCLASTSLYLGVCNSENAPDPRVLSTYIGIYEIYTSVSTNFTELLG